MEIWFLWKIKREFFHVVTVLVLLYGCATLTKRLKKKLDVNHASMLHTILNKTREQHFTKQQLYSYLNPIS